MKNGHDIAPAGPTSGDTANIVDLAQLLEERSAFDRRILQVQKMEAIGQLAGGIAQDFNTLLTVVMGQLDKAEQQLAAHPAIQEQMLACRRALDRSVSLTKGMLEFVRERELRPEALDLAATIDNLAEQLRPALIPRIRVQAEHAPALWPCLADPTQLLNALLALAANGRDAMAAGGILLLATENVRIAAEPSAEGLAPGDYVAVAVADTGAGMTEDVLAKACEPFFTTKPAGKGSGLGLSMVRNFAMRSGGGLAIDSAPGKGTTVRLYLPRA